MVWPETLSRTPWLIDKLAGGPPFTLNTKYNVRVDLEEIQWLCPQREFPSLYVSTPQLVIGLKSSPPKANQAKSASKAQYPRFSRELPAESTSVLMH